MEKSGRFVGDPEKIKLINQTCQKAKDRYGNQLIKIGIYWCSRDFNRFWRMTIDESKDDQYIAIVRIQDGRIYARMRKEIRINHKHWKRRIETGWYAFIDPTTQTIF